MGVYTNNTVVDESFEDIFPEAVSEAADTSLFNPFGFVVDTYRADQALFEALIEVDFAEVYNESGMLVLSEAEEEDLKATPKKGIWEKIKTAIVAAAKWVAKFFGSIADKIKDIVTSDKKLVEKYGKWMTIENLKGCEVKGKYVDMSELTKALNGIKVQDEIVSAMNKIANADESNIDTIANEIKDKLSQITESLNKIVAEKDSGDQSIIDAAGEDIIKQMIDDVKIGRKQSIQLCKIAESVAKKTITNEKKQIVDKLDKKSDIGSKKLNAISGVISVANNTISTYSKVSLNLVKLSVRASRAFWVAAGPYAVKKAGVSLGKDGNIERAKSEEVSKEEMEKAMNKKSNKKDTVIGKGKIIGESFDIETAELMMEMSNMYVDDIFEFAF